jgi:hypothetical protein
MGENSPPARSRELPPARLRLLLALVTLSLLWAFAPDNPAGGLFLSAFVAPGLILYVFAVHSRSGSYLTGWAEIAAVVTGSLFAYASDDGSGLLWLWVPFLSWIATIGGLALAPTFRRWDREAHSKPD